MKSGGVLFSPFLPEETKDLSTFKIISDPVTNITLYDPDNVKDIEQLQADSGMKGKIIEEKESPPLIIFRNKNEDFGFGAVTKKKIMKGERIGEYLGEYKIIDNLTKEEQAYAFRLEPLSHQRKKKRPTILAHETGSFARFVNHNKTENNVECVVEERDGVKTLIFVASKTIPAGVQIFIDYDKSYHFHKESYLCIYQNHKSRSDLLKTYVKFYLPHPYPLTEQIKNLFQISEYKGTHLIIPTLFTKKQTKHQNLPVLIGTLQDNNLMVHEKQPYITALMIACVEKDQKKIKHILNSNVDIFAKTNKDISALTIASMVSEKEEDFKVFLPLLQKIKNKLEPNEFKSYINKNIKNPVMLKFVHDKYKIKSAIKKTSLKSVVRTKKRKSPPTRKNVSLLKKKKSKRKSILENNQSPSPEETKVSPKYPSNIPLQTQSDQNKYTSSPEFKRKYQKAWIKTSNEGNVGHVVVSQKKHYISKLRNCFKDGTQTPGLAFLSTGILDEGKLKKNILSGSFNYDDRNKKQHVLCYLMASECYEKNKSLIDTVAQSFKEKCNEKSKESALMEEGEKKKAEAPLSIFSITPSPTVPKLEDASIFEKKYQQAWMQISDKRKVRDVIVAKRKAIIDKLCNCFNDVVQTRGFDYTLLREGTLNVENLEKQIILGDFDTSSINIKQHILCYLMASGVYEKNKELIDNVIQRFKEKCKESAPSSLPTSTILTTTSPVSILQTSRESPFLGSSTAQALGENKEMRPASEAVHLSSVVDLVKYQNAWINISISDSTYKQGVYVSKNARVLSSLRLCFSDSEDKPLSELLRSGTLDQENIKYFILERSNTNMALIRHKKHILCFLKASDIYDQNSVFIDKIIESFKTNCYEFYSNALKEKTGHARRERELRRKKLKVTSEKLLVEEPKSVLTTKASFQISGTLSAPGTSIFRPIPTSKSKVSADYKSSILHTNFFQDQTKLMVAISNNNIDEIKRLLFQQQVDPNFLYLDVTPLAQSCFAKNKEIVDLLLTAKANPNMVGISKCYPLCIIINNANSDIAKKLLEAGASTDVTTLDGKTIKEYAAERRCSELLEVSALKKNF